ncbi:MBL fold metallo-hydrolase [Horticoccus sp. 23ND18S-11]|uniref:MBL fold metallo-hydrolase n=1 Tax=Horticoccus sp. 23ND18S-11 TaxID=3391832 RepID=UPI0039C91781
MIVPALHDDAFLADVASARREAGPGRLYVWWLGQSGFLLLHAGEFLLFDPYLSDALTKKYAATDKPHVRMTARVVDPARLDFVAVVTSSHQHTDHFDPDTLRPLFASSPAAKLVLPAATLAAAGERLGAAAVDRLVPLREGERVTLGAFTLEAVPAAHEELAPVYAGFVVSVGAFRIYHSGDTVLFPSMEARLRPWAVDLALLPINGRAPERRVSGNLDGVEAARLAHAIGARVVVPCHYEMFTFNTASPAGCVAECARLGQACAVLRAGERWTLDART